MRLFVFFISSLLMFLFGCDNLQRDEITKIITDYKKAQYELEPISNSTFSRQELAAYINDKVKPYLTTAAHQSFVRNRDAYAAVYSAEKKFFIHVDNISVDEIKTGDSKLSVVYTMTLTYTSYNGNTKKSETVTCQADLMKESNTWKISRDWESQHADILNSL